MERGLVDGTSETRRLSTPSSRDSTDKDDLETVWVWYWQDPSGQWIKYGSVDVSLLKQSIPLQAGLVQNVKVE